jgi:hypothetical protein
MPSSAARQARSSGEKTPSLIEKYDRTERWTKEEDMIQPEARWLNPGFIMLTPTDIMTS